MIGRRPSSFRSHAHEHELPLRLVMLVFPIAQRLTVAQSSGQNPDADVLSEMNPLSCCSFCLWAATRPSRKSFCFLLKLAAASGVMSANAGARATLCEMAPAAKDRVETVAGRQVRKTPRTLQARRVSIVRKPGCRRGCFADKCQVSYLCS